MEPFRFKQFHVQHQKSAMKVGTDAVMLGAWANFGSASRILDIGAGCGVMSMMLAQRYPECEITAVEIDELAFEELRDNIKTSPFAHQISSHHGDARMFNPKYTFDGIICNPPFFSDALHAPDAQRNLARHDVELTLEDLLKHTIRLATKDFQAAVVIPFDVSERFAKQISAAGLFVIRVCHVRGNEGKPFKRTLVQFGSLSEDVESSEMTIETARHQYSPEFLQLVKPFYLNL